FYASYSQVPLISKFRLIMQSQGGIKLKKIAVAFTAALAFTAHADTGTWSAAITWPVFAIHMSLLPSKDLLIWNRHRPENDPNATTYQAFQQALIREYDSGT